MAISLATDVPELVASELADTFRGDAHRAVATRATTRRAPSTTAMIDRRPA